MYICMRTTLNIHDRLLSKAKRKAADEGTTLTRVIEKALQEYLLARRSPRRTVGPRWVVIRGKQRAGVDISDRDRLYDAMEGRLR